MLSRVADSLYWMSRYIERAENIARIIHVNLHLILDVHLGYTEQWAPLISITGDHELFYSKYKEANRENVMHFLTFDEEYPNSILACVSKARENARSIREIISSEMWEQINRFYYLVKDASSTNRMLISGHEFYTNIKMSSHLFVGISDTTLNHGEGWHFLRLGRLLERADKTSRIIDVKYFHLLPSSVDVNSTYDDIQWAAVLRSASAFEMYRKIFHRINPEDVVAFLILNQEFPRAIAYCLNKANDSIHSITGTPDNSFQYSTEKFLGQLASELQFKDINEIITYGLHEYIDEFQAKLNNIGNNIHQNFFAIK